MHTSMNTASDDDMTDAPASGTTDAAKASVLLRKKDLLDRAVARSGLKRADMKQALDAILEEMGAALSQGQGLAVPPLGKLRVGRRETKDAGEMLVLRLRRPGPGADKATEDSTED